MDSDDDFASQPTQLLHYALAPESRSLEQSRDHDMASPKNDSNSINNLSLDSRVIPARSVTPCYHLQNSPLQSTRECVLAEGPQNETRQKNGEPATAIRSSASGHGPAQGSGSEPFLQGDNSISASIGKVIRTSTVSFHSPPNTFAVHSLSRLEKSMPVGNRHFRRSPSQDSFASPVLQDPAAQYVASTEQFNIPLSDLGETTTQEAIHSPTDPEITLPDAGEHQEAFDAAIRQYEADKLASNGRGNILVVATPDNSGESSGTSQHNRDVLFFNGSTAFAAREPRFEFDGSSSFDKMLDRGLADSTPESSQVSQIEPLQDDALTDIGDHAGDGFLTTLSLSGKLRPPSPSFDDWFAPSPKATIASSNPRSLLRMVHPNNQYRIAKMRTLAGEVEPPSCVTTGLETQPDQIEETQPCHAGRSNTVSPTRPPSRQIKAHRPPQRVDDLNELEDGLDVVPDSEPLRAGLGVQIPSHYGAAVQSPRKKLFRPLSPMPENASGDLVPDSLEPEDSEAEVPLAAELVSRNPMRSVAPIGNMIVQDSKTTAFSVAPGKTTKLVPEKQPQRPASKNSRVKSSNPDTTEIPTSLPEQDLSGEPLLSRDLPTAIASIPPSSKKKGGSKTVEPSRAHLTTATKPVVGKKRARRSDTESSEDLGRQCTRDEGDVRPRIQKEEEEMTESSDNHVSPPSPPPKSDKSRKKRKHTEGANPARGMSKASTSSRNNPSDTPAVATRSAKRLRSAVRGLTAEPATRVFALWKQDGHYYSGVVHSCGPKNKYMIKFDDRTEDEVELKNMRRRELVVGDRVIIIQDNIKGVVTDVSCADSRNSIILEADSGKAVTTRSVAFGDIRIANRTIQSQWKKRMVAAANIVTVVKPKPLVDSTPSRQSFVSTTPGKVQQELAKTGFVVTINPKNDKPVQMKDEAMRAIKQRGGLVIEDWSSVFIMEGRHSQSNKRWTATPEDFRWKSEVNLDRVFLLSDDAHQKPKFLLALALGIPCLSFDWLLREGEFSSDWQPFLLPAGYSDTLCARISQRVDLDWGNCTEHLTDIMENAVPVKLFSQKTLLCIGAELVPLPSRSKKNNLDEASRYVPWIILCMGAAKVEAVADAKQLSAVDMRAFDYIVVKDTDILQTLKLDDNSDHVVRDVNWVKECLVSSRISFPETNI